ncbi:MAG TPA: hypothetical protein VJZ76_16205 [Thermoanaerobaculia bacterium]|nr:hypothetical protein [Thermoanaerobaculia bacterium]
MFLRILGGFVALVALVWMVMYFTATSALRDAERQPWPYDLGTVEQLEKQADTRLASKEAKEIASLVDAFDLDTSFPDEYVAAQTTRTDDVIEPPTGKAGLDDHEPQVAQLSRVVNGAGDRIIWGVLGETWKLGDAVQLLGASALNLARNGDAAGAWERVHAMWLLARSTSPEPYGAETALKMKRAANAVARKLPPPVPPWAAELAALDPRRDTAAIIQQNTASRVRSTPTMPGPFIIFRPISDLIEASNARRSLAAAQAMTRTPRCRIDLSEESAHSADIYRGTRIDAELEATEKLLALKAERARLGRWPDALPGGGASRCADNHWIYDVKPGGKSMSLRMSFEVAPEPEAKNAPALRFEY